MASTSEKLETPACELLEWDSEHFGFPIAQVTGDRLSPGAAEAIDDWCSDLGVRCLYFLADAGDADGARVAANHGYRMVDVRLTARRPMDEVTDLPVPAAETVEVREATDEDFDYALKIGGPKPPGQPVLLRRRLSARVVRRPLRVVPRAPGLPRSESHAPRPADGGRAGRVSRARPARARAGGHGGSTAIDERHRGTGVAEALLISTFRLLAARGAITIGGLQRSQHRVDPLSRATRLPHRQGRGLASQVVPVTEAYLGRLRIPFNRPSAAGDERRYLAEALDSGHLSGGGPMARQCEALLVTEPGARGAFLTPSATQALEMAALLLDFDAGAEVIVPSFTHPSTVNAFVMRGARPVFCDIRPDTLNIDEEWSAGWSAIAPPPSFACTTPGSHARWTSCSRSPTGPGWTSSRTTPTACSRPTGRGRWGHWSFRRA